MKIFPILGKSVVLIALALAGLLVGCNDTSFEFPDDIHDLCVDAKNAAKACIESKGTDLDVKRGCIVEKVPGTKKFSGGWGWQLPQFNNMWVAGLFGYKNGKGWIQIGCNPHTGGEVSFDYLKHEFGHYWLVSNGKGFGHDVTFVTCFRNWNSPPSTRGTQASMVKYTDDHGILVIDFIDE